MHHTRHQLTSRTSSTSDHRGTAARFFPALRKMTLRLSNQACQQMAHSPNIQAKLKVGARNDQLERQADAMADSVLSMPASTTIADQQNGVGLDTRASEVLLRKPVNAAGQVSAKLTSGVNAFSEKIGSGQALATSVRSYMEPRFGQDFSQVRIHTGSEASQAANLINARAFTVGRDIVFGHAEYNPNASYGMRLLAHELAHVVQQGQGRSNAQLQKQDIPLELQTSINHTLLSDAELQQRYDLIVATLAGFNYSSDETILLEQEAGQIGIEVSRRQAIAAGRTFTPESIERMRTFFIGNATATAPLNCIACMNRGLRTLLDDVTQAMGSEVQTTMARLERDGRASAAHIIEFNNSAGRMTTGVTRPVILRENVLDAMLQMAANDVGWSVFGLSLMDGYHSVTLSLDNNDPSNPIIYWSDQWSSRGGWQAFNRTTLNTEITSVIQRWWDAQPASAKSRTRVTLWRLNQ